MRRAISVLGLGVLLAAVCASDLALAQSQPPSGPRDRRERPHRPAPAPAADQAETPPKPAKPRQRRLWPGRGAVVVVPPSETSSSTDRTRANGPGLAPSAAVVTAAALIGFDETRLKAAIGQPSIARNEGQGALWTYRLKSCALHVFLARDASGALRVKGASSGPLRRGTPTPAVDACVAEAKGS